MKYKIENEEEDIIRSRALTIYYKNFFRDSILKFITQRSKRIVAFQMNAHTFTRRKKYSAAELKRILTRWMKPPLVIHLGSIARYEEDSEITQQIKKEFIIDIDINDYDTVRSCCCEKNFCTKCWILLEIAYKIICRRLAPLVKEEENILPVFSGGRGLHVIIYKRSFSKYNQTERKDLLYQIKTLKYKSEQEDEKVLEILKDGLNRYLQQQPIEKEPEKWKEIIRKTLMGNSDYKNEIEKFFYILNSPELFEKRIIEKFYKYSWRRDVKNWWVLYDLAREIFAPRIDTEVTTAMWHLYKAPYSPHPRTGKIALPIPDMEKSYNPEDFPSFYDLPYHKELIDIFENSLKCFEKKIIIKK